MGLSSADDAAVWKLNDSQALVLTTDFFTPIVDDAYDYGAIAAANSLSDVYAMGGRPLLALNLLAFPSNLPVEVSREILRGGAEKVREAGAVIAGGHSIQDEEPKYGLAVLGIAETVRLLTKGGALPGDHLFLTKPLGFGVTTTAHKRGLVGADELREAVDWMKRLNRAAGEVATRLELKTATDITGFGLIGHAMEMAQASRVGFELHFGNLPLIGCARKFAEAFTFPGGAFDNLEYYGRDTRLDAGLAEPERMLLFDPQTSGGLLLAVPEGRLEAFARAREAADLPAWEIGRVVEGQGITVFAD